MGKKYDIIWHKSVDSTNNMARMALDDIDKMSVIAAEFQTAGRGQKGNVWSSEAGMNLTFSAAVRFGKGMFPELAATEQFAVSECASVAVADFLCGKGIPVSIKWPNDIYVGDRKIAGILIEHRVAGACIATSLCGIGLNVNQREFLSDAPNPVSLWQLTGKELPLDQALEELLVCIDARYARICDYEGLQKDFLACLYRAEGVYGWRDSGGSFQASIAGLDEYGQLRLLDTEGKERVYAFKEVVYLP